MNTTAKKFGASAALLSLVALIGVGCQSVNSDTDANTNTNSATVKADDDSMMMEKAPTTQTPAADLRVAMNSLLKEHVDLGLETLRNAYDEAPALEASLASLDDNSVDIAAAIGSVYGDEAETAFLGVWREHIGFFADYTTGLKTDDDALIAEAEENLKGYGQTADKFFSDANPHINQGDVLPLAEEHGRLIRAAMAAYDEGNYAESYELGRQANEQISDIANALSEAIVKQYPEKFEDQ